AAPLVRATIEQREDPVARGTEDRDVPAGRASQHPGPGRLDVLEGADVEPARAGTAGTGRLEGSRGLDGVGVGLSHVRPQPSRVSYCRLSTPAFDGSCQGSTWSASAYCSRSQSARRWAASSTTRRLTESSPTRAT